VRTPELERALTVTGHLQEMYAERVEAMVPGHPVVVVQAATKLESGVVPRVIGVVLSRPRTNSRGTLLCWSRPAARSQRVGRVIAQSPDEAFARRTGQPRGRP
jgi:hypothetical protein